MIVPGTDCYVVRRCYLLVRLDLLAFAGLVKRR